MMVAHWSMEHFSVLLLAGFVAGVVNALAGGGSFLTLGALVWIGVPPLVANATGTVAQLPGYLAGAWGLRHGMQPPPGLGMGQTMASVLVGGICGAALLLLTPSRAFDHIVPWLLLLATALFAIAPQLRTWISRRRTKQLHTPATAEANAPPARHDSPCSQTSARTSALCLFVVSVYGGYFNGGLGIILLALLGLLGQSNIIAMNGMKSLLSCLLSTVAVAVYAFGGIVAWNEALLMMLGTTAGGYAGARLAHRLPTAVLRWGIVAVGLVLSALFFARSG